MKLMAVFLSLVVFAVSCGQSDSGLIRKFVRDTMNQDSDVVFDERPTDNPPNKPPVNPEEPTEPAEPIDVGAMPEHYMDLNEMKETLQDWAKKAPHLAEYKVYGNAQGQDIFYLRLTDKRVSTPKKRVLINATVHGDEKIATTTIMGVTHKLLANFDSDADIQEMMKTRDIYIAPVTCPDGYARDVREVEGVDPNRSYPWPGAPNARSTKCVQALRDLFEDVQFHATVDYHASGRMWLLPWGYTDTPIAEGNKGNLYRQFGKQMSDLNGYRWGSVPEMVGYIAAGSSADFFFLRGKELGLNTCSIGAEVGTSKHPPESSIATEINKNWKPVLHFIKVCPVLFDEAAMGSYSLAGFEPEKDIPVPKYSDISPYFTPGLE